MSFKDDLLVELLGCGYADLSVLEGCRYDFSEIIEECYYVYGKLELNALASTMFDFGIREIEGYINNRIEEIEDMVEEEDMLSEELKAELHALRDLDVYEDIESFHNYLDTSIWVSNHHRTYKKYLGTALDEFANNTGYCIDVYIPDTPLEKRYRCKKCGLEFAHEDITAEDDKGRDLCPACCKPLTEEDEE